MSIKQLSGFLRLSKNYYAPIKRRMDSIVDMEVSDIDDAIFTHLEKRSAGTFAGFLENYYRRSMPQKIKRVAWPILQAFMVDVRKQAAKFMDLADPENVNELQRWMGGYLQGFSRRYCNASEGQLLAIVNEFKASPDEMINHLRTRLEQWSERRAEKVASDEIVRAQNGMAMETWKAQGVKKFRWVTNPAKKHCPWCAAMSGRVVKSGTAFVEAGQTIYAKKEGGSVVAASISSEGKKNVNWLFGKENKGGEGWQALKVFADKKHPPIHKGCVCRVLPVG